jgi:hypothetical protein
MGASGWEYLVPYQADLQAALNDLRRQVFDSGDYISPVTWGLTAPESLEALAQQEYYSQFMGENGTHSIIDVLNVVPYEMGERKQARCAPSRTTSTRTTSAQRGRLARTGTASAVIPSSMSTSQSAGPAGRWSSGRMTPRARSPSGAIPATK